jgi:hypothetical protein
VSIRLSIFAAAIASGALFAMFAAGPAAAEDKFYVGKTIELLIGFSSGGGYDLYGRTLARYLGRHIPGNPQIVPQNMPGAGSLKLVNYLYNVAPKDGTAIGIFAPGIIAEPLLGHDRHRLAGGHAEQTDRHRRFRRRRRERRVRNCLAQRVPHADPHRHRLSRRYRDHAGDAAPRGRRPLRLVVDQPAQP